MKGRTGRKNHYKLYVSLHKMGLFKKLKEKSEKGYREIPQAPAIPEEELNAPKEVTTRTNAEIINDIKVLLDELEVK